MKKFSELVPKYSAYFALSFVFIVVMLVNVCGVFHVAVVDRVQSFKYNIYMNLLMPHQVDNRIVIIYMDEKSSERTSV